MNISVLPVSSKKKGAKAAADEENVLVIKQATNDFDYEEAFVFSPSKKYRLVLRMDGLESSQRGVLSMRVSFSTASSGKKKKDESVDEVSVVEPVADSQVRSPTVHVIVQVFMSRVETLIEDDKELSAEELKELLHVNSFSRVPVQLNDSRISVLARVWPCLFEGKRRTRTTGYEVCGPFCCFSLIRVHVESAGDVHLQA